MGTSAELEKDIDAFQTATKKLSDSVNKCGIDWDDEQFQELSIAVKVVASASRQIVVASSRYESAITRFQKIESE